MEAQEPTKRIDTQGLEEVGRQMDLLERQWFEAAAVVKRADAELADGSLSQIDAVAIRKVRDDTRARMQQIMQRLEALENSLLLD